MSKNNKLLMIGGGLVALGGAYWAYRRANLPDDIPTSRIPVGASSYGMEKGSCSMYDMFSK